MGVPVQYDEFGQPVSPRFAEVSPKPDTPQICEPERREGTFATTLRVRKWLSEFRPGFEEFSKEMGCDSDVMLLVMAGLISQSIQIVADAIERNTRWVRPRVKRLREMGMWLGEDKLGPRFDAWYAAMTDDGAGDIGPELYIPVLLDILEIDGELESERDADGELRFWARGRRGTGG